MQIAMTASAVNEQAQQARQTARLKDGAEQFEAMMLEQMLKPMHFGAGVDAGGDETAGGENDTLSGFGTEVVAKALAATGGFGLARQVVRQVQRENEARMAGTGGTKVS